jgi:TonB family protein
MMFAMNVTAVQSNWVGQVIGGRFSLRQWLGGSGGGGVFLTELPGTQQKAAIKLTQASADAEARIAFAANAVKTQPHLIRIFESGRCEIDGATFDFVVTEYADEVLSEILPMRSLTADEAKEMLVPVLEALSDLHGQGLVHGRLRPSNILVVNDALKLSADSIQPAGEAAGVTAALKTYDAPERAAGTLSPACDVWSLGATIVEALTQRPPNWNRAENRDPRIADALPQPFAEIAASCLHVDPARRATLNDIKGRLGMAIQTAVQPVPTSRAAKAGEIKPDGKRRPVVLLVVALIVAAAVALLWWRSDETQPATQSNEEPQTQPSAPAVAEPQQTAAPETAPEPTPEPVQQTPAVSAAPAPPKVSSGAVTAKGSVTHRAMPEILPEANRSISGKVNVRIRVNVGATGEVTDAEFESAGPSRYFARVAMEAARQWKFTPPEADGQPVASTWTLRFLFTRGNIDVTPAQTAP